MNGLKRRVERLYRRSPAGMGPVYAWVSYDDGTPSEHEPTPEQRAEIQAADGLEIEIHYVTPEHTGEAQWAD